MPYGSADFSLEVSDSMGIERAFFSHLRKVDKAVSSAAGVHRLRMGRARRGELHSSHASRWDGHSRATPPTPIAPQHPSHGLPEGPSAGSALAVHRVNSVK